MKKADKILIVCIMIAAVLLIFPILKQAPQSYTATVTVKNKEVLKIDLLKDDTYTVKGTLGDVHIQVKNQKIRVTQEKSPHHLCSKQGYVSDANTPIVCLPNETVVQIDSQKHSQDTIVQ